MSGVAQEEGQVGHWDFFPDWYFWSFSMYVSEPTVTHGMKGERIHCLDTIPHRWGVASRAFILPKFPVVPSNHQVESCQCSTACEPQGRPRQEARDESTNRQGSTLGLLKPDKAHSHLHETEKCDGDDFGGSHRRGLVLLTWSHSGSSPIQHRASFHALASRNFCKRISGKQQSPLLSCL